MRFTKVRIIDMETTILEKKDCGRVSRRQYYAFRTNLLI